MFEFPAICRFCSQKTELIYKLDDENAFLVGKLAALAPDTVEFNDIMPQKICQVCHDKLNETYKFQQQIYHVFKIYKTFMEFQQLLEHNLIDGTKSEPFEYVDEAYVSEELRQFISGLGNTNALPPPPALNDTFVVKQTQNVPNVKPPKKRTTRKPNIPVVKRKRGRPRKYCGLMEFKNDDLTDVQKMKDVVVNSVPNIDPDHEPTSFYQQPMLINLRKRRRDHPKGALTMIKEEDEDIEKPNETFIITEQVHQVCDVPNTPTNQDPNTPKGKHKKITRIGAIQSDLDPHEYTYQLPYDPQVTITYVCNAADKFFFCKNCSKQYCDFSSLRKHFVQHSTVKIFQCDLCEYETFTKHCLESHQIVHAADARPETCQECGKTFKSKDRLHRHSYCHMKRFICDVCGKEFSHSALLKKHVQHIHINERNFICSICEFAAKSQEYLNRHMLRHDDNDENKIQCNVCKKLLKTRNSFKIHMKRHEDDRSPEASYWRKAF